MCPERSECAARLNLRSILQETRPCGQARRVILCHRPSPHASGTRGQWLGRQGELIYLAHRPIAVPQMEYTSPTVQSQFLNRNAPHPPTNRSALRRHCPPPPTPPDDDAAALFTDQSRSLKWNIPHASTNRSPSIGIHLTPRPIAVPQ
eukprot:1192806-Prorocentrum_minimum.AAC.3